jgi:hypothetical protein
VHGDRIIAVGQHVPQSPTRITNSSILKLAGAFH